MKLVIVVVEVGDVDEAGEVEEIGEFVVLVLTGFTLFWSWCCP